MTAELALQGMTQPIGVSTHRIGSGPVPDQLKGCLTTITSCLRVNYT
ncbi:hypothetical protein [Leptolyngbya sp. FACHB-16]|nr:hypothetical protein [Leptolyngbya sp. FACHB-16]MBD2156854.1 hypothetical protein [Leptolyngbya sp. FACHB-16]